MLLRIALFHSWQEALVPHHVHSPFILLECPYNMAADPKETQERIYSVFHALPLEVTHFHLSSILLFFLIQQERGLHKPELGNEIHQELSWNLATTQKNRSWLVPYLISFPKAENHVCHCSEDFLDLVGSSVGLEMLVTLSSLHFVSSCSGP